jgi:hypothetical protein
MKVIYQQFEISPKPFGSDDFLKSCIEEKIGIDGPVNQAGNFPVYFPSEI